MTQYNVKYTAHNLISPKIIPIQSASLYSVIPVTLFGRTRLRYGSKMNENFLHLLENFACPSAVLTVNGGYVPDTNRLDTFTNPVDGQFWYDNRMHKMRYYSAARQRWLDIRDDGQVAALCGIISDGEQIPLPIGKNGRTFSYSECSWMVSPFNQIEGINEMRCFTDNEARVTHTYRYGDSPIRVSGIANYIIIAIGDNINLGTTRPTPTALPVDPCVITITGNQPSYVSEQTVTWNITSRRNSTITFFIDSVELTSVILDNNGNGSVTFSMPEVEEDTQIEVSAVSSVLGCGSFSTLVEVLGGDAIPCSITGSSTVAEDASINVTINSGTFPGTYAISSTQTTGTFSPAGPFTLGAAETQVVSYTAGPVTSTTSHTISITNGTCSSNLPITVTNVNSCSISASSTTINENASTTLTINSGAFPGIYTVSIVSGGGFLSTGTISIPTANTNATVTYTAPSVSSTTSVTIRASRSGGGCSQDIILTVNNIPATDCAFFTTGYEYAAGAFVELGLNSGTFGATYIFSDGGAGGVFSPSSVTLGVFSSASVTYSINPSAPTGIVFLTATGGGCSSTATISVTESAPSCSMSLLTTGEINPGDPVSFTFTSGAAGTYFFSIGQGDGVELYSLTTGQTITLTKNTSNVAGPDEYTATVTGPGCSQSVDYTVTAEAVACSVSQEGFYSSPIEPGTGYTVRVITGSTVGTYTLTVTVNGVVQETETYAQGVNTTYSYEVPFLGTPGTLSFNLSGPGSCTGSASINFAAATPCSISPATSTVTEDGTLSITVSAGSYPAAYTLSATPNIGSFTDNGVSIPAGGTAIITYNAPTVSENTSVTLSATSSPNVCTPTIQNIIINNNLVLDVDGAAAGTYLSGTSDGSGGCTAAEGNLLASDYIISGSGSYEYTWAVTQSSVAIGAYTGTIQILGGNTGPSVFLTDVDAAPPDCPPNSGPSFFDGEVSLTVEDTETGQTSSVTILVGLIYSG